MLYNNKTIANTEFTLSDITKREKEVLHLISLEHSSKEIASMLFISMHTVISHRKNMMQKVGVKNTAGLVRAGFEKGWLQIENHNY